LARPLAICCITVIRIVIGNQSSQYSPSGFKILLDLPPVAPAVG
jgi:hypothetical protein